MIRIWTDGSSAGRQTGHIGYAAVIDFGDDYLLEMAAWCSQGTNNTAELKGAIMGLWCLRREACLAHGVEVITDSEYTMNQALGRHSTNTNRDLVATLQNETRLRQAKWTHVRGHRGNAGNTRADKLAVKARRAFNSIGEAGAESVLVTARLVTKLAGKVILSNQGPRSAWIWNGERWVHLELRV